jgi:hypothetical protein
MRARVVRAALGRRALGDDHGLLRRDCPNTHPYFSNVIDTGLLPGGNAQMEVSVGRGTTT